MAVVNVDLMNKNCIHNTCIEGSKNDIRHRNRGKRRTEKK